MHQIHYTQPLVYLQDNGNILIAKSWHVTYDNWYIDIPVGFVSDGNSVPRWFRGLVPKFGRNTLAGIVHDYVYYTGCVTRQMDAEHKDIIITITRKTADQIRHDICCKCSVPKYQTFLSYLGLRLGGFMAWRAHRKRETLRKQVNV